MSQHRVWVVLGFLVAGLAPAASGAESLFLAAYGIYQCNLDGSNLRLLHRLFPNTFLTEVATNSRTGTLYWIEASTIGGTWVHRLDLGGRDTLVVWSQRVQGISSITVDEVGKKLYYAYGVSNGDEIRQCDLDGRNPRTVLSDRGARVYGLDVVPQSPVQAKLYWSETNLDTHEGRIGRADVFYGFGMNPEIVVSDLGFPSDLSVDPNGRTIYWVDYDRKRVQRANWDGSVVETLVDSNPNSPYSLTLDLSARRMYWVDFGADLIERADLDGSNREGVFTVYGAYRIDIGPNGPVGIDKRRLGQMKQMYRPPRISP